MLLVKKEGLIYQVEKVRVHDIRKFTLVYDLQLICGWDYVDTDYSNEQGYISPNNFIEEVQDDTILVYFDENLKDRLEEEGYKIINQLPNIIVKK